MIYEGVNTYKVYKLTIARHTGTKISVYKQNIMFTDDVLYKVLLHWKVFHKSNFFCGRTHKCGGKHHSKIVGRHLVVLLLNPRDRR